MSAMAFHSTATRLWKSLSLAERRLASTAFFEDPPPDLVGSALAAVAEARRMRPQAARALPADARARILATLLDPGETLAQGLLVALHLKDRRALLAAFLDALGMPHEDGILKDEEEPPAPVTAEAVRAALGTLGRFPDAQVETYLNTLWLQDPERWGTLPEATSRA
jgi:hypothetical protein